MLRIIAVVVLSLCLGACGFHLRGHVSGCDDCDASKPQLLIQLIGGPEVRDAAQVVEQVAQVRGQMAGPKQQPNIRLGLQREIIERKVIAIDSRTGWQEIQMKYQLLYDFKAGERVSGTKQIVLIRSFTFKPTSILSAEGESESLMDDIRNQAANQLLDKLGAQLSRL